MELQQIKSGRRSQNPSNKRNGRELANPRVRRYLSSKTVSFSSTMKTATAKRIGPNPRTGYT